MSYFDLLPKEIKEKIITLASMMNHNMVMDEIKNTKYTQSIWRNPSNRLLDLCTERGGIQPRYYDQWKLHPSFIAYRDQEILKYSVSKDMDEIEKEIEYNFDAISCSHFSDFGKCQNCLQYKFPCSSKCSPVQTSSTYDSLWNKRNYQLANRWDISDEPSLRELAAQLDFESPDWRAWLQLRTNRVPLPMNGRQLR